MNHTTASIRSAAYVCRAMAEHDDISGEQHGTLLAAAAILGNVGDDMEEERTDSDDGGPQVIPIPPEALTEESAEQLVKWVYGQ